MHQKLQGYCFAA